MRNLTCEQKKHVVIHTELITMRHGIGSSLKTLYLFMEPEGSFPLSQVKAVINLRIL
jgi:hypothetical protein